jgi:hypothetical protein
MILCDVMQLGATFSSAALQGWDIIVQQVLSAGMGSMCSLPCCMAAAL